MKFNDHSAKVIKEVDKAARQKIQDIAEVMTEKAKELTPRDTGHNSDSIRWQWVGALAARVFTESGYGAFLELGTSKRAATPYMKPAYDFAVEDVGGKPWVSR